MKKKFSFLIAFLISSLLHTSALHAWWSSGHRIAAEIAYESLNDEVKIRVDDILSCYNNFYPDHAGFVNASLWADDIASNDGIHFFDACHYTDMLYDPEQVLTEEKKQFIRSLHQGRDVIATVEHAKELLKNEKASPYAKALALHLLIHVVADIHQPLHTTTRYTVKNPEGDRGGNDFSVLPAPGTKATNLHALWDSGVGAFPIIAVGKTNAFEDLSIKKFSKRLTEEFPESRFPLSHCMDARSWAMESHELAVNIAYRTEEGKVPSEQYIQTGQEICRERITLAGYRLANVLNDIFSKGH